MISTFSQHKKRLLFSLTCPSPAHIHRSAPARRLLQSRSNTVMVNPSLPEELLAQVMSWLRPSTGPIRGLEYVWPKRNDERVQGPYSDPAALVNKKQHDNSKACRRTLASCMQASRGLCRIARAVYYETIEADQLFPFMQLCITQPKLADHVRELCISGQNSPLAAMAVVSCTNLEKLVVKDNVKIEHVLPVPLVGSCATLFRSNKSASSRIPLSNLRTLAIQAPSQTDIDLDPQPKRRAHNWIELITHLPKMESIEIFDGFLPKSSGRSFMSNLKSLTITSLPFACNERNIRCILTICPFLESLDLTTRAEIFRDDEPSSWSEIGEALSRNGANLRKFRYDSLSRPTAPGLMNVSSLRKLLYLAVPLDALVAQHQYYDELGATFYGDALFRGNRHGYGGVYDIEDMWAESILGDDDIAQRDGSKTSGQYDEEEAVTEVMLATGPNLPFFQLLPESLQHFRVLDDVDTVTVASYVDKEIRDLVLHRRFSELRDVQVRRRVFFTEHVKDIGWHLERRPFWNVMRRT